MPAAALSVAEVITPAPKAHQGESDAQRQHPPRVVFTRPMISSGAIRWRSETPTSIAATVAACHSAKSTIASGGNGDQNAAQTENGCENATSPDHPPRCRSISHPFAHEAADNCTHGQGGEVQPERDITRLCVELLVGPDDELCEHSTVSNAQCQVRKCRVADQMLVPEVAQALADRLESRLLHGWRISAAGELTGDALQ